MKRKSVSMFWFRAIVTEIVAAGGIMALLGNNHAPPTSPSDALPSRSMVNRSGINELTLEDRTVQDRSFTQQPPLDATTPSTWSPIESFPATPPRLATAPSRINLAWASNSPPIVSTLSPSAWHGHGAGPRLTPSLDRSRR